MSRQEALAVSLKEIDTNELDMQEAYNDLQSDCWHASSFSLNGFDSASHLIPVQESLPCGFDLLGSLAFTQPQPPTIRVDAVEYDHSQYPAGWALACPESESSTQLQPYTEPVVSSISPNHGVPLVSIVVRSELKKLCENMNGIGLREYIKDNPIDRELIRCQLTDIIRLARDPGLMVLEAMDGLFGANGNLRGNKVPDIIEIRRACLLLLEVLMGTDVNIGSEVRERAKTVAFEWKGKVTFGRKSGLQVLVLLQLMAAYGLGHEFEKDDLVEYFVFVANYPQCSLLCKVIGLGDNIHDFIQNLVENGKLCLAVKYIFEFELADKYPLVPFLETFVEETNRMAEKVLKDGGHSLKSQNEATAKELGALKSVIKVIEGHKLEAEYPKEFIEKRIELLKKQKAYIESATAKLRQPPWKLLQSENKRSRNTAPVGEASPSVVAADSPIPFLQQPLIESAGLSPKNSTSAAGADSTVPGFLQPHVQQAGFLLENYVGVAGANSTVPLIIQPVGADSTVSCFQQPHIQPTGFLPEKVTDFIGADSTTPYFQQPHVQPAEFLAENIIDFTGADSTAPCFLQPLIQPAGFLPENPSGVAGSDSTVLSFQEPNIQPAGFLPEKSAVVVGAESIVPRFQQPLIQSAGFFLENSAVVAYPDSTVPSFQQPHVQSAGFFPENSSVVACPDSTAPNFQQPHVQPAEFSPENSTVGPYGVVSSSAEVASYAGRSVGLYGWTEIPMVFRVNSNPAPSDLYFTEEHLQPGYQDRSVAYGGNGVPSEYHPTYYPQ